MDVSTRGLEKSDHRPLAYWMVLETTRLLIDSVFAMFGQLFLNCAALLIDLLTDDRRESGGLKMNNVKNPKLSISLIFQF
jgi:hypothetical protein